MAYDVALIVLGAAVAGTAVLRRLIGDKPISMPILYMLLGIVVFSLPWGLPDVDVHQHGPLVERLTELGVIVSLMGAGLKMGRPVGLRRWGMTWRLLGVTMVLSIAAGAWLGHAWLGLAPAAALLLGAVLAPTDPVLAGDVHVHPPGQEEEGPEAQVRFALTSEAGLNDGLAFPFVHGALMMLAAGSVVGPWVGDWLLGPLLLKVAVGVAGGLLFGWLTARVAFRLPGRFRLAGTSEGMLALAVTLLAYGATEVAGGYGFLAVFVAGATIRSHERDHAYHAVLHRFSEQAERLLMTALILLFGGAIAAGIMAGIDAWGLLFAGAYLLVVRPVSGVLGMLGVRPMRVAIATSFIGTRGIGSFYYLSYALNHGDFPGAGLLWSTVAAVVMLSIILHGITATPVLAWVGRHDEADATRS